MDQFDREEKQLSEELEAGEITVAEYNREMAKLQRYYRETAEEASQEAYDREMDRW